MRRLFAGGLGLVLICCTALGPALAEKVLDDLVIYRLGVEPQARLREAGLTPGAVTVTARGVEITLQRVAG